MKWKMARAKQQLSEVVRRASRSPQILMNRDTPVAGVVCTEDLEEFLAWRASRRKRPLVEVLTAASRICDEETYILELAPREDRPSAWAPGGSARAARRHQRRQ